MLLYEQIQAMVENKLYTNVAALAPMVLSAAEHNPDLMTPAAVAQTMVYLADALMEQKEFGKAEAHYRRALELRKTLAKGRGAGNHKELQAETDVRYRMHLCHLALKQPVQALIVLQGIPAKLRSVSVNMALGKLYILNGMDRSAVSSFKEVLRECPLALDAVQTSIRLGVGYPELMRLMFNGTPPANLEWLAQWVKGQCHLQAREYLAASSVFGQLREASVLKDDVTNLVSQGTTFFLAGDYRNALQPLQRAHALEPLSLRGMDVLAAVLAHEKKAAELEALALKLIDQAGETHCQPWVAMGYHHLLSRKLTRALYLAHKACTCAAASSGGGVGGGVGGVGGAGGGGGGGVGFGAGVEPLILKGHVLQELKKYPEAITHYREGLQVSPHRYELYAGVIHCYLALQRSREAANVATNALHHLGHTPRILTLYASVLLKDPSQTAKGRSLLEKALSLDANCLTAVFMLVDALEQAGQRDKALEVLAKRIDHQPTNRLHHTMADLLVKSGEPEKALEHYTTALMLEPNNVKTMEAINRLENALVAKLENHLELEADDVPESDDEQTIEDVEIDPIDWADVNFAGHFSR